MKRAAVLFLLAAFLVACAVPTTIPHSSSTPADTPGATNTATSPPTPDTTPTLGPGAARTRPQDGMVMVYVPGGEFTMGSPEGEGRPDERPQHLVSLDAYWIDRTEVTNAQYRACAQAGACAEPGCVAGTGFGANDQPVGCVSWVDAVAYCRWVGARLPTEAEWEKAARGTDARAYPWGNEEPDATRANFDNGGGGPSAVGSYPAGASPYGALDMAGNVWEWVNDWYGQYGASPEQNPQGPSTGTSKVVRGGAFTGSRLDTTDRVGFYPDESRKDCAACNNWGPEPPVCSCSRQADIGFRCAAAPYE